MLLWGCVTHGYHGGGVIPQVVYPERSLQRAQHVPSNHSHGIPYLHSDHTVTSHLPIPHFITPGNLHTTSWLNCPYISVFTTRRKGTARGEKHEHWKTDEDLEVWWRGPPTRSCLQEFSFFSKSHVILRPFSKAERLFVSHLWPTLFTAFRPRCYCRHPEWIHLLPKTQLDFSWPGSLDADCHECCWNINLTSEEADLPIVPNTETLSGQFKYNSLPLSRWVNWRRRGLHSCRDASMNFPGRILDARLDWSDWCRRFVPVSKILNWWEQKGWDDNHWIHTIDMIPAEAEVMWLFAAGSSQGQRNQRWRPLRHDGWSPELWGSWHSNCYTQFPQQLFTGGRKKALHRCWSDACGLSKNMTWISWLILVLLKRGSHFVTIGGFQWKDCT